MDQLDLLLEQTREPEPSDDLFVARVVNVVRADTARSLRRRRFLTRPIVLAGAAVLVTGGAVAAFVGTAKPHHTTPRTTVAPKVGTTTVTTAGPTAGRPTDGAQAGSKPGAATQTRKIYRRASLEWGYLSSHTSYVLDHDTGLKIETDTKDNSFAVQKLRRVTVTMSNTGKSPISLDAPKDCALQVMGFSGKTPPSDPSKFNPDGTRDPGKTSAWTCAGSNADPRNSQGSETIVLAPGAHRTGVAKIVLHDRKQSTVMGLCQCSYVDANQPKAPMVPDPLDQLSRFATTSSSLGVPAPLSPYTQPIVPSDVSGIFTPPIGLRPA